MTGKIYNFPIVLLLLTSMIFISNICKDDDEIDEKIEEQWDTYTDTRDGKVYKIIEIGSQTWFAQNLNYVTAGSWNYANNQIYGDIYGRLYTFEEAQNVCPDGWRLASDDDWKILIDYLGGEELAGGKLKEDGLEHWVSPNQWATNESGFTALPGGFYYEIDEKFYWRGNEGHFWTSSVNDNNRPVLYVLYFSNAQIIRMEDYPDYGCSVRCIKN